MIKFISKEKGTQSACLQLLSMKKIFHYRQNTGATRTENGGFIRFGVPGSPDIVCILKICYIGVYVGLEIKDEKGRLSENQKLFKDNLEKNGGFYFVIKNIDDCIKALEYVEKEVMRRMREGVHGKTQSL